MRQHVTTCHVTCTDQTALQAESILWFQGKRSSATSFLVPHLEHGRNNYDVVEIWFVVVRSFVYRICDI